MNKAEYLAGLGLKDEEILRPPSDGELGQHHSRDTMICARQLQAIIADPNVVVLDEEERKHLIEVVSHYPIAFPCSICKTIKEKLGC